MSRPNKIKPPENTALKDAARATLEARKKAARASYESLGAESPDDEDDVAKDPERDSVKSEARSPAAGKGGASKEDDAQQSASAKQKVGTLAEPYKRGDGESTIRVSFSILGRADKLLRKHVANYPYISRNDFVSHAILEKLARFESDVAAGRTPDQPVRRARRVLPAEEAAK